MRNDVFTKYYETMANIITYTEIDKWGDERTCTVSVDKAEKNPKKYKIYKYKHPELEGRRLAYDPEIVKKFTNTFKELCGMLPQRKLGLYYEIYQKDLLNSKPLTSQRLDELIIAETFFAMAEECNIMSFVFQDFSHPGVICGNINGVIPTTYKEEKVIGDD